MTRLRRTDLEAVIELLGYACELEGPEPFPVEFLAELGRVTRAFSLGYVLLAPRERLLLYGTWFAAEGVEDRPELEEAFWDTAPCPTSNHRYRTGDMRAIRISDLLTRRAYHALPIYQQYFLPHGVEDGLEVPLPRPPDRDRFLMLWRPSGDVDFSPRDRDVLEVLRPHLTRMLELAELRERVVDRRPPPEGTLTPREQEILDLVAGGKTNAEIAATLWVAPSTVKKHLENVYEKLGVSGRTAAIGRVHLGR